MTTAGELVTSMCAILAAEREGIRRLDSSAVERASRSKEVLMAEVERADPVDRVRLLEGLAIVRDEMKRNLVLLAHARDCTRAAILHAQSEGAVVLVSIQL